MDEQYVIFAGDHEWRVGVQRDGQVRVDRVPASESDAPESQVQATRQKLVSLGYADQPVVLALPSSWCLCAKFSTEKLDRRNRRRAMGFIMEEHLPVSIEQVVADYIETGDGGAVGVCSELERLKTIVDVLDNANVPVWNICPAALLSAGHASQIHPEIAAVLIMFGGDGDGENTGSQYDWLQLHKGALTCWRWLADDERAVRGQLESWTKAHSEAQNSSAPVMLIGDDEPPAEINRALKGVECIESEEPDPYRAAVHHGAKLLKDTASPWIELRRDELAPPNKYKVYRKPIGALVAAAIVLLVSICGIMQWRGRQYKNLRRQYISRQAIVFEEALPKHRIPGGSIKRRMLSERRKLARLSGQGLDETGDGTLKSTPALVHLRNVLSNLPKDLRYRILALNIRPGLIRIDGQARSHAEADRIAVSLRETGLYEVDPPETHALDEHGVSFEFAAKPGAERVSPKEDRR